MGVLGQKPLSRKYLTAYLADVSADSDAVLVIPERGEIKKIWSAIAIAISAADATVTVSRLRAGADPVELGDIVIESDSAAVGDVDTLVPTSNQTVEEGDVLLFASDGGSSTTAPITFTVELETAP